MADKKQLEEETAIEKLNDNLTSVGTKIAENKKVIYWVVGAVVVVAALIIGYIFIYHNPKVNKANEAFNQVEITAMGNDSVAAVGYKKVADEYGSTDAGKLAALSAAEAYYNQANYKEAIKYLEKFSTSEPVLNANAKALKGDCYVNLKQYDKALEAFNSALKAADKNPQIAVRVLLKEANVYDAQKKYDKALECYEAIKADYPTYELGNGSTIDAYIARENARLGK
jgi:tetratricopeptide (TPR) repeat protein